MNKPLKIGTVFSGIGAVEQALNLLSIPHEISFACDNGGIELEKITTPEQLELINSVEDKNKKLAIVEEIYSKRKTNFVKKSYLANYPLEETSFFNDIRFIGKHINKEIDLLVGGSPCQSFSVAGTRGGFEDTRGTLFFEFARCVKEFQPAYFIFENVKGLLSHDHGKTIQVILNTFEDLGYKHYLKLLNAKDYNIPQNRQRIFIVGFKEHNTIFEFPKPEELLYSMSDFLIGNVDAPKKYNKKIDFLRGQQKTDQIPTSTNHKYFLSEKIIKTIMATSRGENNLIKINPTINTEIAKTLVASMAKMHRANVDNYVTENNKIRRLTPRECLRLMGFPDSFKQVVSDSQMYKQAGNSIVVDVLMAIIKKMPL
jgi:DNA (cytosine-5)-methyltransferase 1